MLSAGSLATVVTQNMASAGVPSSLISSTVKAAAMIAAGQAAASGAISVKVTALTEGVLKAMLLTRLKTVLVIVLVFGSLTLVLHDELFIKLKPTIIYLLFGAVLLGGLAAGKSLLGMVFDSVFHLTEEGWRRLTLRWALFFFALAILNEIVWRSQTTDVWVTFKVFGVVPLTFLFAALQYPLLTRYAAPEKAQER